MSIASYGIIAVPIHTLQSKTAWLLTAFARRWGWWGKWILDLVGIHYPHPNHMNGIRGIAEALLARTVKSRQIRRPP